MIRFITLNKSAAGEPGILVNAAQIRSVEALQTGCRILFDGGNSVNVREDLQEVARKLKEGTGEHPVSAA